MSSCAKEGCSLGWKGEVILIHRFAFEMALMHVFANDLVLGLHHSCQPIKLLQFRCDRFLIFSPQIMFDPTLRPTMIICSNADCLCTISW